MERLSGRVRGAIILGLDAVITATSFWLALNLRFDFALPEETRRALAVNLLLLILCRLAANAYYRLHRWSFRFSSLTDGARLGAAVVFGTGLFALAVYLLAIDVRLGFERPPRSVIVIEPLLSALLMAAVRFGPRLALSYRGDVRRARERLLALAGGRLPRLGRRRAAQVERTLIVGAGAAGELLVRDLIQRSDHRLEVVGFVDDNPRKLGHIVCGRGVLGRIADLPQLVARYGVEKIVIAIPGLPAQRVRQILSSCATLHVRFKTLPGAYRYQESQPVPAMLQDLAPEDLLEREAVALDGRASAGQVSGRTQLVTGAAGSIGSEVCAQLLALGSRRLVMVDVDESGLYLARRHFLAAYPEAMVAAEVADVRDAARIEALFARYRPNDVFHAAARKHVPLMEGAPCEAIKVNVQGTRVVASAAEHFVAERFVFMSTDKAVRPTSVMGASKRLGELYVRQMAANGAGTRFSVVRFGNVLGSTGSVVELFRAQIAAGGPVTVTHPDVRRFFMTIPEAVGLVLGAAYGDYGQLCVLEMGEPMRILDLARHMITMSGQVPDLDVPIEIIGLRPGEKLFEELLDDDERVVARVERKVQVVEGPPPPADLERQLDRLVQAAVVEDAESVLALLRQLVPSYRTPILASGSGKVHLDDDQLDGMPVM